MDDEAPSPSRLARHAVLWATGLVVAIKLIAHFIDPQFHFYIGDSNEYLKTASEGYFPPGRSWLYGRLVRWLSFGSLEMLVWVQTFASTATCLLIAWISVRMLGAPAWFGVAAAGATAMSPFHLLFERTILTESFGILAFTLFIAAALAYLRSRHSYWLVLAVFLGLLCISLRLAFLPLMMVAAVAMPVLAWLAKPEFTRFRWMRSLGFGLGLSLSVFFLSHTGYRHLTGKLAGAPPAYQYQDGWYMLVASSVALKPEHASNKEMREIIEKVPFAFERASRTDQMWDGEGVRYQGYLKFGEVAGNDVARVTALKVFTSEPVAMIRNSLENFRVYWSGKGQDLALKEDLNAMFYADDPNAMSQEYIDRVNDEYGHDLPAVTGKRTVVKRWYMVMAPWLSRGLSLFLPAAALALLLFWRRMLWRRELLLLLTLTATYLGVLLALTLVESFRLLFPLEPLALLTLAALLGRDSPTVPGMLGLYLIDPMVQQKQEAGMARGLKNSANR